jgi:hypothetical protein
MSDIVLSSVKGVSFPIKTTAEKLAIVSPDTGAVVYDSDLNQLSVYDGTSWGALGGGGGAGLQDTLMLMGA